MEEFAYKVILSDKFKKFLNNNKTNVFLGVSPSKRKVFYGQCLKEIINVFTPKTPLFNEEKCYILLGAWLLRYTYQLEESIFEIKEYVSKKNFKAWKQDAKPGEILFSYQGLHATGSDPATWSIFLKTNNPDECIQIPLKGNKKSPKEQQKFVEQLNTLRCQNIENEDDKKLKKLIYGTKLKDGKTLHELSAIEKAKNTEKEWIDEFNLQAGDKKNQFVILGWLWYEENFGSTEFYNTVKQLTQSENFITEILNTDNFDTLIDNFEGDYEFITNVHNAALKFVANTFGKPNFRTAPMELIRLALLYIFVETVLMEMLGKKYRTPAFNYPSDNSQASQAIINCWGFAPLRFFNLEIQKRKKEEKLPPYRTQSDGNPRKNQLTRAKNISKSEDTLPNLPGQANKESNTNHPLNKSPSSDYQNNNGSFFSQLQTLTPPSSSAEQTTSVHNTK